MRFGLPALLASFIGAWALVGLANVGPLFEYTAFGHSFSVAPAGFAIGVLLLLFALVELIPALTEFSFPPRYLTVGGFMTGFFGGFSGMQGAMRSAFLARAGLSKEAYIATGAVIATLIDVSRIGVYFPNFLTQSENLDYVLVGAAVFSAFAGAYLGNRFLKKITMRFVQRIVAILLFLISLGLMSGAL